MPTQLTRGQKIGIAVVAFAATLVTVMLFLYLMTHPVVTNRLRDISIIVLAITLIVLDIAMMVLMWQIIKLLTFLITELKPVLESLQETSNTVRGTASFVGDGVTSPMIGVSSKAAGAKGSLRFVLGSLGIRGKKQPSGPAAGYADWTTTATGATANAGPRAQEPANHVEREGI